MTIKSTFSSYAKINLLGIIANAVSFMSRISNLSSSLAFAIFKSRKEEVVLAVLTNNGNPKQNLKTSKYTYLEKRWFSGLLKLNLD